MAVRRTAASKSTAPAKQGGIPQPGSAEAKELAGPAPQGAKKTAARKPAVKKAVAATKTATANITAARKTLREVTEKAPAKKAAAAKVEPKEAPTFEQRDWTYLDDKAPSEQHEILAREINRRTNLADGCPECETEVPISPKQVQAVLAMFPHFQRSATNKARSGYHALAPEIVEQRSVHMTLAHKDAAEQIAARQAAPVKKAPAKRPAKKATAAKK